MNETNDASPSGVFALHGVRCNEALARFAGDEQRYRHWLLEFTSSGPAAAGQIRAAVGRGDRPQAIDLSHALKGRTAMLGMAELHSIVLSLEMTLKNEEPSTLWLEELERTVDEMSREISSTLGASGA